MQRIIPEQTNAVSNPQKVSVQFSFLPNCEIQGSELPLAARSTWLSSSTGALKMISSQSRHILREGLSQEAFINICQKQKFQHMILICITDLIYNVWVLITVS